MAYEFNYKVLGFKDCSIKKSNTNGQLYHIKYAGRPIIDPLEVSSCYHVRIACIGHKKTYPRFTFELTFSTLESKLGIFGPILTHKKVDIFDSNHEEFLKNEAYKRLIEIVRIWSLELNSKFEDDFDEEYFFTGNILIASASQTIPIKDYVSIISKFDLEKYSDEERDTFCTSIKEVKIDELIMQYQREQAIKEFDCMLQQEVKDEGEWQNFFEYNKWMFGFGLDYIWVEEFKGRKLEQVTTGSSITGAGKRPDAFLKTQADISTTVFVEIKTPLTQLVTNYRPDTWSPAPDLIGGVSQIQKNSRLLDGAKLW